MEARVAEVMVTTDPHITALEFRRKIKLVAKDEVTEAKSCQVESLLKNLISRKFSKNKFGEKVEVSDCCR